MGGKHFLSEGLQITAVKVFAACQQAHILLNHIPASLVNDIIVRHTIVQHSKCYITQRSYFRIALLYHVHASLALLPAFVVC